MGSITKRVRKDGKAAYRAKVTGLNGDTHYKTFDRKIDARAWISKTETNRNTQGLLTKKGGVTLEEYVEFWLNERKTFIAPRTYERIVTQLNKHILPEFGKKKIGQITHTDGKNFQKTLMNKNLSSKTANMAVQTLNQILIYASKGDGYQKQLYSSPFNGLEKLPESKRELSYWEAHDVKRFLSGIKDTHYYMLYLTAINTGFRLGELAGLQKKKIDFGRGVITVSCALVRVAGKLKIGPTKTNEIRHFPMNEMLARRLKKYCEKKKANDFVFTDPDGKKIDLAHFARVFRADQERVGIQNQIRFHDLRHTYASNFMMSGGDIFTLKSLLGHNKVETTLVYAHLSPTHMKSAGNLVKFEGDS